MCTNDYDSLSSSSGWNQSSKRAIVAYLHTHTDKHTHASVCCDLTDIHIFLSIILHCNLHFNYQL